MDISPTFTELALLPSLISALNKQDIIVPMPIQSAAFPIVLSGKDVFISSETGTGKTLGYLLPILTKIDLKLDATQVIIVLPTHELALQIHKVTCDLSQGANIGLRAVLLLGGTSIDRQIEKLKKKPHIVLGSPGRIIELIKKQKLKTKNVNCIVIDEADRQLAGDSLEKLREIISSAPKNRQLIYVSATEQRESYAEILSQSPDLVSVCTASAPVNPNIEHKYICGEQRDKPDILRKLIHATKPVRAIAFVHRNETAELITRKLDYHGISVVDLHGTFNKYERKKAMEDIKSGKAQIMIASDVAARGLDIPGISHIFNLDLPTVSKDYLHRVGRAARAGAKGVAISLLTENELPLIRRYQKDLGISITEIRLRKGEVIEIPTKL